MQSLLDKIKNFVVYDADRDFYAQVFPGSVPKNDLLRIRRMTLTDIPMVLAIEQKNYQFPWDEEIFRDCFRANYDLRVCEDLNNIVGYCIFSYGAGEAHILNVSVAPTEQNQGVGRKMLEHMIDAMANKAETIYLEVRPTNTGAIALYKKLGFNEIGIRKGYYPAEDGREDALMLAMQIYK